MSAADRTYLAARTSADFENGGHRTYFQPSLAAVAAVGNEVATYTDAVEEYYGLVAGLYASVLAYSGGTLGVGYDQTDVPLRNTLGSAAFVDVDQIIAPLVTTQDATYQILPQDFGNILRVTSGTRTWTLPSAADLPDRAPLLWVINRSGSNLTINRSGSDTLNAAATSYTLATGGKVWVAKASATTWEIG